MSAKSIHFCFQLREGVWEDNGNIFTLNLVLVVSFKDRFVIWSCLCGLEFNRARAF